MNPTFLLLSFFSISAFAEPVAICAVSHAYGGLDFEEENGKLYFVVAEMNDAKPIKKYLLPDGSLEKLRKKRGLFYEAANLPNAASMDNVVKSSALLIFAPSKSENGKQTRRITMAFDGAVVTNSLCTLSEAKGKTPQPSTVPKKTK